jgi:hypothetical protein
MFPEKFDLEIYCRKNKELHDGGKAALECPIDHGHAKKFEKHSRTDRRRSCENTVVYHCRGRL